MVGYALYKGYVSYPISKRVLGRNHQVDISRHLTKNHILTHSNLQTCPEQPHSSNRVKLVENNPHNGLRNERLKSQISPLQVKSFEMNRPQFHKEPKFVIMDGWKRGTLRSYKIISSSFPLPSNLT